MKLNSGKLVIVGIIVAAVAAAGFAWWRQYERGRRALDYWGAEGARLIRTAPNVELLKLSQASDPGDQAHAIAERRDVSNARGLVHARQALISDLSFVWDEKASSAPAWEYALVFRDGSQECTVLLELTHGWAAAEPGRAPLRLGLTLTKGLKTFLAEQFDES